MRFLRVRSWCSILLLAAYLVSPDVGRAAPGVESITFSQDRRPNLPLTIHVVRIPRSNTNLQIQTIHAQNMPIGLGQLSTQIRMMPASFGKPLAGINGDFYLRGGSAAGLPRGIQVIDGELTHPPTGGPSFWVDAKGEPHAGEVSPALRLLWTNGTATPFSVNTPRRYREPVLYTPTWGPNTRTSGGKELLLEPTDGSPWLPLRPGRFYKARVKEVREGGNSRIPPGGMILSLDPGFQSPGSRLLPGSEITLSTATLPSLKGATCAIGGGPVLLRDGKAVREMGSDDDNYSSSSMDERHPRAAIGWNKDFYFLVQVDGRRRGWSIGLNLRDLSAYLLKLGCTDAMNLDGGGSATIWFDGQVQNQPCDGYERQIANALVVVEKRAR